MHIAVAAAGAVDVYRLEKTASNATRDHVPPAPDPLAEFEPEQPVQVGPVPFRVRPAPGGVDPAPRGTPPRKPTSRDRTPSAVNTRRPLTPVERAKPMSAATRHGIISFVLGSMCGALLCVVAVYSMRGREVAPPEPDSSAWEGGPSATASFVPAPSEPPVPETPAPETPASEPPASEPPARAEANELRDPPAIDKDVLARPEPTAKTRAVREAVRQAPTPGETKRAVFVGALQIDSTPQGAQVFVDRKPVGVTPALVSDLSAGSHAIRIEADGHLPWSSAVRVVADRQNHVTAILSPSPSSDPGH